MKILIIKLSSLGDVLQIFDFISFIRKCYPKGQIDWVIEKPFADVVKAHPDVQQVILAETKKWRKNPWRFRKNLKAFSRELRNTKYDLVIDLQGNCKSGVVNLLARGKEKCGFGRLSVAEWPNLLTTKRRFEIDKTLPMPGQYLQFGEKILKKKADFISGPRSQIGKKEEYVFMVCFSSNWKNKKLKPETLLSFLKGVRNKISCRYVFIWKGEREKEQAEWFALNLGRKDQILGDLSVPMWQDHMRKVDLIFSMDSSGLHLAATTETPSFGFFGPSIAPIYNPPGKMRGYFQGECPYHVAFLDRCPRLRTCETGACLKEVPVDKLLDHFFDFWKAASSSKSKSI